MAVHTELRGNVSAFSYWVLELLGIDFMSFEAKKLASKISSQSRLFTDIHRVHRSMRKTKMSFYFISIALPQPSLWQFQEEYGFVETINTLAGNRRVDHIAFRLTCVLDKRSHVAR